MSFSLPSLSDFSLQGNLSAAGQGRCTFSFLGSGIEHSFVVEDGAQPIDLSGQLPAGQYFLFVNLAANVNVDLVEEASRAASASFSLRFSASPPVPNQSRSWSVLKSGFR